MLQYKTKCWQLASEMNALTIDPNEKVAMGLYFQVLSRIIRNLYFIVRRKLHCSNLLVTKIRNYVSFLTLTTGTCSFSVTTAKFTCWYSLAAYSKIFLLLSNSCWHSQVSIGLLKHCKWHTATRNLGCSHQEISVYDQWGIGYNFFGKVTVKAWSHNNYRHWAIRLQPFFSENRAATAKLLQSPLGNWEITASFFCLSQGCPKIESQQLKFFSHHNDFWLMGWSSNLAAI